MLNGMSVTQIVVRNGYQTYFPVFPGCPFHDKWFIPDAVSIQKEFHGYGLPDLRHKKPVVPDSHLDPPQIRLPFLS